AWFGTRRSWVQIPPARFSAPYSGCELGSLASGVDLCSFVEDKSETVRNSCTTMAAQDLVPPLHFSVAILGALIGLVVLFFGRELFWLCVAALGFAAGVQIAPQIVPEPSPAVALIIAIALGVIGALLALFLQKVAIAVLGFVAGGYLANGAAAFFIHHAEYAKIIFVAGGLVGAILLLIIFDWALIVASALVGAHLILGAVVLPPLGAAIIFLVLALVGIAAQATAFRKSRGL